MSIKTPFWLAGNAQPLILVPVHVNGRGPYEFILDTGAVISLLDSERAAELGVAGPLSQIIGAPLDGIVGYNFLKEFRVTMDYPHDNLCLE